MRDRIITVTLLVGILLVGVSLLSALYGYRLPGNNQGYRPVQPIEYSHRVHAGELAIPCLYCHAGAERSRNAGIPSANMCMNCHQFVSASLGAVREEERVVDGRHAPLIEPGPGALVARHLAGGRDR